MLVNSAGNSVLGQKLADRAPLAFRARTVVAPDVKDKGVLFHAQFIETVDQLANLSVNMLGEASKDFHQPPLKGALRLRDAVPSGHALCARRQFGVRRNPAQLLLALEDALAQLIPAIVEAPFVFVGPLFENVVRPMRRARRPIHEERLVGRESPMAFHPGDRLIGKVLAQMIFRVVGRLDWIEVLIEPRLPLRRLARQKAIEIIKTNALAGRPPRERPHGRGFGRGRVVPFAECGGFVPIFAEHFGERCGGSRDHTRIAVPIHGALGDGARPELADDCVPSAAPRASANKSMLCGRCCN